MVPVLSLKRKRGVDQVNVTAAQDTFRATAVDRTRLSLPRGTIPGFPPQNVLLPPGLQDEELIKTHPNHLRGEVLLGLIDKGWCANEILELAQCPQLKPNTFVKRICVARIKRDGGRQARRTEEVQKTGHSAEQAPSSQQPKLLEAQLGKLESKASQEFRIEQTHIRDIAVQMKPDMFTRSCRGTKRTAAIDRLIAERAAAEYEKRIG